MEELTLDQQIEVINLRVERRRLLSEEPSDDTGMKSNRDHR